MRILLLLHPTRITESILTDEVYPVLDKLAFKYQVVRRGQEELSSIAPNTDFIVVLGGDGTFLAGARLATVHRLPILGVMVGRLGFLCTVTLAGMGEALAAIQAGKMQLEERYVLFGKVVAEPVVKYEGIAVKDIVVSKVETDKIRDFTAKQNGKLIAQYRADGIILASPSGSTAYTLAAGGPLVHPGLDLVILTPICAHSLFTKPLVIPANENVEIAGKEASYPLGVSFDGVTQYIMEPGDKLIVSSHRDHLRVYRPAEYDFYQVLRQKFQHGYVYGGDDA
ncbi:NAD(+)/NADH kinase [bacterium]|nr:NAD(+)/NADH kinase [bacterium]